MQLSLSENIKIFNNAEFGEIRVMLIDDDPWFVGKDIAVALGYAKPENALSAHVDEQDKTTTLIQGDGSNYKSKTTIINESGLYSLIFSSKLEKRTAVQALGHSRGLAVHPQAWDVYDRQPVGDSYCQPGLRDRPDSEHENRKGKERSVADAEQAAL